MKCSICSEEAVNDHSASLCPEHYPGDHDDDREGGQTTLGGDRP